jgi:hypothetical protein
MYKIIVYGSPILEKTEKEMAKFLANPQTLNRTFLAMGISLVLGTALAASADEQGGGGK